MIAESDIKEIIKLMEKPVDRTNFISIEDGISRTLLDNYFYLICYQDNVVEQLQIVSKEILFYSRYYWFNKFMKRYFSKYGCDAGNCNFFIKEEDLKNRDFSKVEYDWQCC